MLIATIPTAQKACEMNVVSKIYLVLIVFGNKENFVQVFPVISPYYWCGMLTGPVDLAHDWVLKGPMDSHQLSSFYWCWSGEFLLGCILLVVEWPTIGCHVAQPEATMWQLGAHKNFVRSLNCTPWDSIMAPHTNEKPHIPIHHK